MAQNFVNEGLNLTYTVPASTTIESGQLVAIGAADDNKMVGVSLGKGTTGDVIEVAHHGVWEVAKAAGVAVTQGQKLYFVNGTLTTAADDAGTPATPYPFAGYAWESALAGASTVTVKIG